MDPNSVLDPSDDEEIVPDRHPQLPPFSGVDSPNRSAGGPMARLGLHFSGGFGAGATPLLWHDGRFSDWTVTVGEKTYHLHAFLLARASFFFESHMSMAALAKEGAAAATRGSDLTEVLPQSCHAAFEDALDFVYSENQAGFEAPASKALLLLKIADILGIGGLFEAMGRRIEAAFSDTAPLLLEQYCCFHIPGTDDGAALGRIRVGAVELIVRKFQPFLAIGEMRAALLRLPSHVLAEILEADDLLVANEDIVFDFVAARLEVPGESPETAPPGGNVLWQRVRWAHLSAAKFARALALREDLLPAEVAIQALTSRVALFDLGGTEALGPWPPQAMISVPPRRPILPPGVPPPNSSEIDFCFHYTRPEHQACGEALRSQPKRIGDLVLRLLIFPSGTDTGVARGSLSVFLEAVPQPRWPRDWEFANIRYAIACIRWPTGSGETWAAKRKSDLWTFKAGRLDRGWHDFLAPGEIGRYLGPDGFVCIRGSLEPECLGRTFLLNSTATHSGYPGTGSEAAGSSASRRSWVPRAQPVGPNAGTD